jgi:hypothetical protein
MPQEQGRALRDDELLTLFNSSADLSLLSQEERLRLVKITDPVIGNPADSPSVMNDRSITDRVIDHLPSIGGALGGFIGKTPVAGTVAAGAMGAGGEIARQVIRAGQGRLNEIGNSAEEGIARVGAAGALNAGQEAGGRAVMGGLRRIAPVFMRNALGAQTQVRKDFPDVDIDAAAIRERVVPGTKSAFRKVSERGAQHAATARNNLRVEDISSGNAPVVGYDDAVSELRKRVPDARMAARGGESAQLDAVKGGVRKLQGLKRRPLNAEESFVSKQSHQDAAKAAYAAKIGARGDADAAVSGSIAQGMNAKLKEQFPQHAPDMQKAQEMIALERALFNAAPRTSLLRNAMAGAAGAGSAATVYGVSGDMGSAALAGAAVPLAVGALTSPSAMGRYGIAADMASQAMQGPGARIPDALVRQQLLELLMGRPDEQKR